jgi:hypothetical protein
MAFLYIDEYAHMGQQTVGPGNISATYLIPVATQKVVNTGASTQSAALQATTKVVRLHADSICSFLAGANPTATTGNTRLAANQTEYFGVTPGSNLKIAAILNT